MTARDAWLAAAALAEAEAAELRSRACLEDSEAETEARGRLIRLAAGLAAQYRQKADEA